MARLEALTRRTTRMQAAWGPAAAAALVSAAAALFAYAMLLDQPALSSRKLSALGLGSVALAVGLYPLNSLFLFPPLRRLRLPARTAAVVATLLFGLYLTSYSPWKLPRTPLLPAPLTIQALEEAHPASSGNSVELLGFRADGGFISYETLRQQGDWQREGASLTAPEGGQASLRWRGRVRDTVLLFRGSPDAGTVRVTWRDVSARYDLYSPTMQEIPVHDLHTPKAWERALVTLAFGGLLGYASLLLVGLLLTAWPSAQPSPQPASKGRGDWKIFPLAFLAFLLVTRSFGLWIVSDSSNYLSAARHFVAGQGYIALNGDTYDWWPPLYPNFLSLLELLPFDELGLMHLLHVALFGLNLVLAARLARQMLPERRLFMLALALTFFSTALLSSTNALLSEPVFNLFLLGFLICLVRYLETGDARAGIFSAVFAAMVPMTRYAGVTAVIAGCLALLVVPRLKTYPTEPSLQGRRGLSGVFLRLLQAFAFGLAASFPMALWIGRNYLISGWFTGPRTPSTVSFWENLHRTWVTISGWYLPGPVAPVGFGLALALLLAFLWLRWRREGIEALGPFARPAIAVPAVFSLVYVAQLVITLSIVENAGIGDRLLSPVFVPLTFLLLFAFWRLAPQLPAKWMNTAAALGLSGALLVGPLTSWANTFDMPVTTHNGHFSIYSLKASPLIEALRAEPLDPDLPAYSNCPRCMYVFAHIHPVAEFNDTPKYRSLPADRGPFYIVWFDEVPPVNFPFGERYPLPNVEDILGQPAQVQTVARVKDGAIYLVAP